ncbi:MAG TPA: DUF4230 domain-containing protein [Leptolyngbyaceae cyanobacterium M65_K2018_010]|nr:DUF4230 domain-containing protein [Leptolyngbyaceae cyanobacterium M65_K2018_010]
MGFLPPRPIPPKPLARGPINLNSPAVPQAQPWLTTPSQAPSPGGRPWRLVQGVSQVLAGGILMLGLVVGVGLWRSGDRFLAAARLMFDPAAAAPQVDVRSLIVQQLRGASELTTAVFAMEAVVPTRSDRTLAGYVIGSTNLLYIAYGEVRAGVDLSQITVTDGQLEGDRTIQVTLPPPQILDSKLDLAKSQVYDYDRGFWGLGPDDGPDLQERAQREALSKIEAAACAEGVLAEANRRAELAVGQLLTTAGFQSVVVRTQAPIDSACADLANSDRVIPGQE